MADKEKKKVIIKEACNKMNDNKKVLFLINSLKVGGAEKVFIRDVNALAEKGFSVYIGFLFGGVENQTLLSSLRLPSKLIFYCNSKSIIDFQALLRLRNFIKKEGITTVISTLNEANIWNRLLKILFLKIRCIIREANVTTNKPLKFKIFDILSYPITNCIWAVSQGVKDSFNYIPQSKIKIIENWVPLPEKSSIFRDRIDIPKILYVGSLTPKKSLSFLIDGMKTLKSMGYNFTLDIVGEGSERGKIEALIVEYNLNKEIKLHGQIEDDNIRNVFYEESDIFILPSKYEGSPNVLLKAMSYKLPVITSDFQGALSLIENYKTGIIVQQEEAKQMAEAVIFYIQNLNERKRMIDSAYKIIKQNYTMEVHINNLIKIINHNH